MAPCPRRLLPLTLALLAPSLASAADLTDWLRFDAFGTLATYRANDPVAGVRSDQRTSQVTRNGDWRFDGDSQITGQFTLNPTGKFKGVLQVLAKDDVTERFKPQVEWLYASYDISSNANVKLGRVVAPVFLLSDTRNVAYSQTSARPNQALYQINPITSIDGLNGNWTTKVGEGEFNVEAAFGKTDVSLTTGTIEVKRTASLAGKYTNGPLTLRYGRTTFKLDGKLPATQAALNTLASGATGCTNCASVFASRIPFVGVSGHMDSVAGAYDDGNWTLQTEWSRRLSNSAAVPDVSGWYAQAGYRLGALTPYVAVGKLKFSEAPLGLQTAGAAPPAAAAANAAFDLYLQNRNDRSSRILGVRWDFRENFALKVQFEALKLTRPPFLGVDGVVSYPNARPIGTYTGPAFDGKVNLLSVNLDFVI